MAALYVDHALINVAFGPRCAVSKALRAFRFYSALLSTQLTEAATIAGLFYTLRTQPHY